MEDARVVFAFNSAIQLLKMFSSMELEIGRDTLLTESKRIKSQYSLTIFLFVVKLHSICLTLFTYAGKIHRAFLDTC